MLWRNPAYFDKVLKSYSPAMTDEKRLFKSKRIADRRRIEEENQISQLVAKDVMHLVERGDRPQNRQGEEGEEAGKRWERLKAEES